MNEKEFVESFKKIAPAKEDLTKLNLPEDFINDLLNSYNCEEKVSPASKRFSDNILLNLISGYDCSKAEIGMIRFLPEVIEKPAFYQVGKLDVDVLVLDKISLGINVVDARKPRHIMWKCASNGEKFLEALLISAKFLVSKLNDMENEPDPATIFRYVNQCSEVAGGDEYKKFYKLILGYFE